MDHSDTLRLRVGIESEGVMLIAVLTYIRPLEEVDTLLPKHREYLQRLFDQKKLLICGKLRPRTGGVIIARNISRKEFEKVLQADPFAQVSRYEIIEFIPSLWDDCLQSVIGEEL